MLLFGTGASIVVSGCLSNENENSGLDTDVEEVWDDDTTSIVFQSAGESVIFESDAIENLDRIRRYPEGDVYPKGYSFEVVLTDDASTELQEFVKSHRGNQIALGVVYQGTAITSHESPEPIPDDISEDEIEDGVDEIVRIGGLTESELSDVVEELGFSLIEESGNPESVELILVETDGDSAAHGSGEWNPFDETSSENRHVVFDGSEVESVNGPYVQQAGWRMEFYLNDESASRYEDTVRDHVNPDMVDSSLFFFAVDEELVVESSGGYQLSEGLYENVVSGDFDEKFEIVLMNESDGLDILVEFEGRKYVE